MFKLFIFKTLTTSLKNALEGLGRTSMFAVPSVHYRPPKATGEVLKGGCKKPVFFERFQRTE